MTMTRRDAIKAAAALGASLAWGGAFGCAHSAPWRERRELYPQGIASADPHSDSVLLWTRRETPSLAVEIAGDPEFRHIISRASRELSADSDWTCRFLVAGLEPARVYWYRFIDAEGNGSRIGRTITAPAPTDDAPVRFAFVSCQNLVEGAFNAYRRMIWEDERAALEDQLQFVLHLGDYVYEVVDYPEDRPNGKRYGRRLREVVRYPTGEKIRGLHIPATLEDYRALWRGYLADPDLQDARARWPFVCVWDNHEFSWTGWQSQQNFGENRPAQRLKVAANQTWFEYQPARVLVGGKPDAERFIAPAVVDAEIREFDENGLGLEPNNLAAIGSLTIYRSLKFGRNVDLILTDNRSYTAQSALAGPEADAYPAPKVPYFFPQEAVESLDAAKRPRILGKDQKAWFFDRLRRSQARWKIWGNSFATLDWRSDLQNLPPELHEHWPLDGFGALTGGDWTAFPAARAEIFDFIRRENIAGFASVVGDRHAFVAGLMSKSLPPGEFDAVGVEFVTGSISAPGLAEATEYNIPKDHPLRALFVYDSPDGGPPACAMNVSVLHGVRSSLALQRTNDAREARAARNADVSPHLSFVDFGGHGYSVVRAAEDGLRCEFVCIPRPLERSETADGGPLRYRVAFRVKRWAPGERPTMERIDVEGVPPLAT